MPQERELLEVPSYHINFHVLFFSSSFKVRLNRVPGLTTKDLFN